MIVNWNEFRAKLTEISQVPYLLSHFDAEVLMIDDANACGLQGATPSAFCEYVIHVQR